MQAEQARLEWQLRGAWFLVKVSRRVVYECNISKM